MRPPGELPPRDATESDHQPARHWKGPEGPLIDRAALIDAAAPPVSFVLAARVADVPTAAAVALAVAALVCVARLVRRRPLRYAAGGLAGVGMAAGAALWLGEAGGYFAPAIVLNTCYAVLAVVSIAVRRPLIAWAAVCLYRWPLAWFWHPRVRPAYSELTWAWAGLFALRAGVRYVLVMSGQLELLAVVHVALGIPAFAALLVASFWYLPRRLARLGAPDVADFQRSAAPSQAAEA